MVRRITLSALLLAAAASPSARAADDGFYVGAGVTQAKLRNIGHLSGVDLSNTSYKIIAGVRPIDLFAVEANYVGLGSGRTAASNVVPAVAHARAFAAYGVLLLPTPFVDVYARTEAARWKITGQSTPVGLFRLDAQSTQFAYGAGGQLRFGPVGARVEPERYDVPNAANLDHHTVGAIYSF
jgi:hypothetical protein